MGDTLSFECDVDTCQESIEIAILKGSQLLTIQNFTNGKEPWVHVSLTVAEDTADIYQCLALLPNGMAFNETFRITGNKYTPYRRTKIHSGRLNVQCFDCGQLNINIQRLL